MSKSWILPHLWALPHDVQEKPKKVDVSIFTLISSLKCRRENILLNDETKKAKWRRRVRRAWHLIEPDIGLGAHESVCALLW